MEANVMHLKGERLKRIAGMDAIAALRIYDFQLSSFNYVLNEICFCNAT